MRAPFRRPTAAVAWSLVWYTLPNQSRTERRPLVMSENTKTRFARPIMRFVNLSARLSASFIASDRPSVFPVAAAAAAPARSRLSAVPPAAAAAWAVASAFAPDAEAACSVSPASPAAFALIPATIPASRPASSDIRPSSRVPSSIDLSILFRALSDWSNWVCRAFTVASCSLMASSPADAERSSSSRAFAWSRATPSSENCFSMGNLSCFL